MNNILSLLGLIAVAVVGVVIARRWVGTTRAAASVLGILAGLVGAQHGFYEMRQGNVAPSGILIHAVGPPCQAGAASNNCLPAMTIIPSFFVAGVITIIVALVVLIWAAAFVQRKRGGLVLILLSVILLLVGGGFFPPGFGVVGGAIGSWRRRD